MATCVFLSSTADTSNTTSYTSSAFTPSANSLMLVFVHGSGTIATGSLTSSAGTTFVKIDSALKNASSSTVYLFVAGSMSINSSQTVTFDCTGDSALGAIIQVWQVGGMARAGANAVAQTAKQENQTTVVTAPAPTFASNATSSNPTIGIVANTQNPAAMTPPTGWTEGDDTGHATPSVGSETVARNSGFSGTTITWGGTSGSNWCSMIVELNAAATPLANNTLALMGAGI